MATTTYRGLPVEVSQPDWFDTDLADHLLDRKVRLVGVDVETTNLNPHPGSVTEVGWFDLTSGFGGGFIPPHRLDHADEQALAISRYHGRIAGQPQRPDLVRPLHDLLGGDGTRTVLVGSNPNFDQRHLTYLFGAYGLAREPWHRRPICVAEGAYWLGLGDVDCLPGLAAAADAYGVCRDGHHDALADTVMAAHLYTQMWRRRRP